MSSRYEFEDDAKSIATANELFLQKLKSHAERRVSYYDTRCLENEGKCPWFKADYYDEVLSVWRFSPFGALSYNTDPQNKRGGKTIRFFAVAVTPVLKSAPADETVRDLIKKYVARPRG